MGDTGEKLKKAKGNAKESEKRLEKLRQAVEAAGAEDMVEDVRNQEKAWHGFDRSVHAAG